MREEGTLEFRVLGPLEVLVEGQPIEIVGTRQRALLTILLLRANEVVSRDRLIDDLWGERPPETAPNALAALVARLRKALPAELVLTRPAGYELRLERQALDLHRFETLVEEGSAALAAGDPAHASELLRAASALWRGPPLAEFAYEPFAQPASTRLAELRLVALENRIEADLALGRHLDVVGEVQSLVGEHPLRDRLRGYLMLALYRSGRQAEALEAYRRGRRVFVDELGIEPGPALQELEQAILRQDPSAAAPGTMPISSRPARTILVAAQSAASLDHLLSLAAPLARGSERELIVVLLVSADGELSSAATAVHERRESLARSGVAARAAAFVSATPGEDIVRLTSDQNVELALLDQLGQSPGRLGGELATVLDRALCDVGILVGDPPAVSSVGLDGPVVVPFGGGEHEWAAMEIGAWLASAGGTRLKLLGTAADPETGRRDASRLLAAASLVLQQAVGVSAEPVLVQPGAEGMLAAASEAAVTVLGLPERRRTGGLEGTRLEVATRASTPVLLVRGGVRPGGLAPNESLTRYTWTIAGAGEE
jgi:DNA-binding SARP family transcriptional activator